MKEMIILISCLLVMVTCSEIDKKRVVQIQHYIGDSLIIHRDAE
jgi:hypothetical protein